MSSLDDAFAPLMKADPVAFRAKYRKMASDPHAFYRGSACLFYADVTADEDPFTDEHSGRIWIHGDLHVENFGTYLNSDGRLVFDVNDFDEAYLGRFTWDLQRFAASLALVGWQKALPEEDVRRLIGRYLRAYLSQVDDYRQSDDDDFALHLDNTHGPIRAALVHARGCSVAPTCWTGRPWSPTAPACSARTPRCGSSPRPSGPRWSGRSRATSRRSRRTSGSTATCSTTCATSSASPGSGSAAPACRRTTCSSRASARRWTTTWCCR